MAENNEPLIKLEPGGKAPILSYNVPEPTSYNGTNFIELSLLKGNETDEDYYQKKAFDKPEDKRTPVENLDKPTIRSAVKNSMANGFIDTKLLPNVRINKGTLKFKENDDQNLVPISTSKLTKKLELIDPDEVASAMSAGKRLNIYESMTGAKTYNYINEPKEPKPRLFLIETHRLSSFLGNYGAGRIVKTFSLLPGERTKVSVKSYTKTESTRSEASSILDSFTQESADDFESSIQQEQSNKESYDESFEYYVDAEAKASWGWGSASVKAGVKGSTNSAREESAKNITNATEKHSSKSSAKRDVEINTNYEVTQESGEETSIEREIENINLSRTLNFVFRQMNQEFITLLHLVDVRVSFFNGFAESKIEVTLPELDSLLDEIIIDSKRDEVRKSVFDALTNIFDYKGNVVKDFIRKKEIDGEEYWQVNTDKVSEYKDSISEREIPVPGIILSTVKNILRTEGIIVEAMLGQGNALDTYATELQKLEVEKKKFVVGKLETEFKRSILINKLTNDSESEKAEVLRTLISPCCKDSAKKLEENEQ